MDLKTNFFQKASVPIIQFSLYFLQNVKSLTTKPASRRIYKNSLLQKQINVNKQIFLNDLIFNIQCIKNIFRFQREAWIKLTTKARTQTKQSGRY